MDAELIHQAQALLRIPRRGVHVVDAPGPALGVPERVLLPVVVDGAAGACLAERLALDDPHVDAVDPLDVGDPVLVAFRRPFGEQVVALGHVCVGVDHSNSVSQLDHSGLLASFRLRRFGTYPRVRSRPLRELSDLGDDGTVPSTRPRRSRVALPGLIRRVESRLAALTQRHK
ncbi:hypothetical protein FMEAI12_6640017 [Parafrankia sp. Ea1.12]|nr:hypothetical protein FMEAI12_6640017 [Parafrankia sp. Ea1.12]